MILASRAHAFVGNSRSTFALSVANLRKLQMRASEPSVLDWDPRKRTDSVAFAWKQHRTDACITQPELGWWQWFLDFTSASKFLFWMRGNT